MDVVTPTDVPRDTVRSGLERLHVDPFRRAVGDRRPLTRLEIESVEASRQIEDAVDIQRHHAGQRARRAGETLKPDVDACARARAMLFDDVREDAVASGKGEAVDNATQELFEMDNRLDLVARRIQTDDDVATSVRQAFEH